MRSLLYRLVVLLVLVAALAHPGGPVLAAPRSSDSAPLPLNEYWSLVEHTRQIVAGLSAGQIAQRLGRKPGTVRVWLHRASRMLAKTLAPLGMEVRK